MQLSKNFSLAEMVKSEAAIRLGLDNNPNQEQIENLKTLVKEVLQPIRDNFGKPVKVNSGFRCPYVNLKIGGSKNSDHCKGLAADIEIPSFSNYLLAKWIKDNLKYTQLILEFYTKGVQDSGWVHVSYDKNNLKKEDLTAIKENGKTVYLKGLDP